MAAAEMMMMNPGILTQRWLQTQGAPSDVVKAGATASQAPWMQNHLASSQPSVPVVPVPVASAAPGGGGIPASGATPAPGGGGSNSPGDLTSLLNSIYSKVSSYDPSAAINQAFDQQGQLMGDQVAREWGGDMANRGLPPSASAAQNAYGLAMAPAMQALGAQRASALSNAGEQQISNMSGLAGLLNEINQAAANRSVQQQQMQLEQQRIAQQASQFTAQQGLAQQQFGLQQQQGAQALQQGQQAMQLQAQEAANQQKMFTQSQQIAQTQKQLDPSQYYGIPGMPGAYPRPQLSGGSSSVPGPGPSWITGVQSTMAGGLGLHGGGGGGGGVPGGSVQGSQDNSGLNTTGPNAGLPTWWGQPMNPSYQSIPASGAGTTGPSATMTTPSSMPNTPSSTMTTRDYFQTGGT